MMTEELILTQLQLLSDNQKVEVLHYVGYLLAQQQMATPRRPQFGRSKGRYHMADNFDEPLDDFNEYME